jgi:magnesium-protoporphyrin IX monomethyl ester (oxidative) cyclase
VTALARGQTNYVRMLWKFRLLNDPGRLYADHARPVTYEMRPPRVLATAKPTKDDLFVHLPSPVSKTTAPA